MYFNIIGYISHIELNKLLHTAEVLYKYNEIIRRFTTRKQLPIQFNNKTFFFIYSAVKYNKQTKKGNALYNNISRLKCYQKSSKELNRYSYILHMAFTRYNYMLHIILLHKYKYT